MVAALLVGTLVGKAAAPGNDDKYKYLSVFTDVLSRIKTEYVSEPDVKNVTLGAMNGLLESLDPYASYLNADQYKQYLKTKETRKADVGLTISKRFGYVGVVNALEGSPAALAGLTTNSILETINGVSTRDMPLAYAELLLAGDPGTEVEIGVLNVGGEPKKLKLKREAIKRPAVASKVVAEGTGYVQAQTLEYGKVREIAQAVQELKAKGVKRVILDLRNNGAGDPLEGVALANLFLNKGTITYMKGQKVEEKRFEADASKAIWNDRLVVLVNKGTAAGAEIAAAALLENKRADLVGEKTYGNAAMRQAILLEDGSAVILATAKYYAPVSQKPIQDNVVTPNVPEFDYSAAQAQSGDAPEEAEESAVTPQVKGEDTVLKKAIEVAEKGAPAQV